MAAVTTQTSSTNKLSSCALRVSRCFIRMEGRPWSGTHAWHLVAGDAAGHRVDRNGRRARRCGTERRHRRHAPAHRRQGDRLATALYAHPGDCHRHAAAVLDRPAAASLGSTRRPSWRSAAVAGDPVHWRAPGAVAAGSGRDPVFFPDGASTGGRIDLQVKDARWRVDVGWITGEVRSGPLRTPSP